jgi:hypothetical protein
MSDNQNTPGTNPSDADPENASAGAEHAEQGASADGAVSDDNLGSIAGGGVSQGGCYQTRGTPLVAANIVDLSMGTSGKVKP